MTNSLSVKILQEEDYKELEQQLNYFAEKREVRATQTHVSIIGANKILYTAVIFFERVNDAQQDLLGKKIQ